MTKLRAQSQKADVLKSKKPCFYSVVLLNEIPQEYLGDILKRFFPSLNYTTYFLDTANNQSRGLVCGIYTYEIAETSLKRATDYARNLGFTIKLGMKKIPRVA